MASRTLLRVYRNDRGRVSGDGGVVYSADGCSESDFGCTRLAGGIESGLPMWTSMGEEEEVEGERGDGRTVGRAVKRRAEMREEMS